MRVKCTICDQIDHLNDDSPEAKRLRNHLTTLYLCKTCNERIAQKTNKRHMTGNFKLYRDKNTNDHLI